MVEGLPNSNFTIKSLVIQGHLNGKSRDKISKETKISTGSVSNILKDWKRGINIPEIDELRAFAITVKKSGLSIEQCAQGYKTAQILKSLGVVDDVDDENEYSRDIKAKEKNIGLPTFIEEIYLNCKNQGIPPAIIPSWIKDLLNFHHNNSNDSIRTFNDRNDDDEYKKQTTTNTTILNGAAALFHQDNTTKAGSALNPSTVYNNNQNSCLYENKITSSNSNPKAKAKAKSRFFR
jgi:hypothetical protein